MNGVVPRTWILLADGFMELKVIGAMEQEIQTEVITGGLLGAHKEINLPTGTFRVPSLRDKDREDLLFGLRCWVDYVALSFKTEEDRHEEEHHYDHVFCPGRVRPAEPLPRRA